MVDLRIEKRNGAMIWKQEIKKLEKDMRISVDDDCVALCLVGGMVLDEYRAGERRMLNEGGRLSKQYKKSNFSFIVFNREKPASVKWGVGKTPVTYEDRKLGGIALSISAYGHCDVVIHDASKLWAKMPSEYTEDDVVEASEIESFIQKEIIAKVAPILSKELNKIGDYTKVTAAINDLNSVITYAMPDLESMGLHVEKVVIEGLKFTDESEEIIEKHKESKVAKLDTDIAHERAEQLKSVLDAVSGREDR